MAFWSANQQRVIYFKPEFVREDESWLRIDCGCCNGLTWWYGEECSRCDGRGFTYKHIESGVLARWPGGPFLGREAPVTDEELEGL